MSQRALITYSGKPWIPRRDLFVFPTLSLLGEGPTKSCSNLEAKTLNVYNQAVPCCPLVVVKGGNELVSPLRACCWGKAVKPLVPRCGGKPSRWLCPAQTGPPGSGRPPGLKQEAIGGEEWKCVDVQTFLTLQTDYSLVPWCRMLNRDP